jgi:hypothetical protein
MVESVIIINKTVKLVPEALVPPISLPIQYISDDIAAIGVLPDEIKHSDELKWHTLLKHPRWKKKNAIQIAVLCADRGNDQRSIILKMCRKAKHPVILLFPGGGYPGSGICAYPLYLALKVQENVIIFSWSIDMTPVQKAVFQYLLRHWDEIPWAALTYIKSLPYIPNYHI